jgi:hypothetical protein
MTEFFRTAIAHAARVATTGTAMSFGNLPPSIFPFRIEFISIRTDEIVHTETVDAPGVLAGVLATPALATKRGPVWVRVTYADGEIVASGRRDNSS